MQADNGIYGLVPWTNVLHVRLTVRLSDQARLLGMFCPSIQ